MYFQNNALKIMFTDICNKILLIEVNKCYV
jgi:hypothetical protein